MLMPQPSQPSQPSQSPKVSKKTVFYFLLIFVLFFAIWSGAKFVNKRDEVPQEIGEPGIEKLTGKLVKDFPQLPVYPDAVLLNSNKTQEKEKVGFEANWEVNASVFEVMTWYVDAFSESGWIFEEEPEVNETFEQYFIAERNGFRVQIIVEKEEGGTLINAEFPFQQDDSI